VRSSVDRRRWDDVFFEWLLAGRHGELGGLPTTLVGEFVAATPCTARRAAATAAHLVDEVLAHSPSRQWTLTDQGPWWAALTVWCVVNAVCVLQAVGFLSRITTSGREVNRLLGYLMIALALPAAFALIAFVRARAGWLHCIGPIVYIAFVALMLAVDYIWPVEFRSPPRSGVLAPYLVLFFGSILLMGLPMFRLNRSLWLVTVTSATLLLISMVAAIRKGVG
jgi:hypothetical protein